MNLFFVRRGWLKHCLVVLLLVTGVPAQEIWRLGNVTRVGAHVATPVGAPRVVEDVDGNKGRSAVRFDGVQDGLFLPVLPLAGSKSFTIEILFRPEEGGPEAQRFLHLQDRAGARALIETRLSGKGTWWIDTFLFAAGAPRGLALIEPKHAHPTNRWYWAALRYDGTTMAHFVNGTKEMEGAVEFGPFGEGETSIGVRLNKVHWFKGDIAEVRFHREAVTEAKLQRVK